MVTEAILRTTVVGSYPQPDWLIDKGVLRGQLVPRVRTEQMWRIAPEMRAAAIQDAALVAIRAMETAGIDVITDGETARESYCNHFTAALGGIDGDNPATILSRTGHQTRVPRVVGPIRHQQAIEVESAKFLRAHTDRRAKITLPGPFTLAQQAKDEHYHDIAAMAFDFAIAINQEARALEATGIDVIQLDEPWLRNDPDGARRYGLQTINRALQGLTVRTAVHVCFGYAFLRRGQKSNSYEFLAELWGKTVALGVLDHSPAEAEPVEVVARRIRAALAHLPPDRLMPAPDCGMKYMTREVAFGRLRNLSEAAARVRQELTR